ncbi:GntR family transcriptional regulator [Serinicoccus kebangsaanensis]|uniref:GntR family transcriptional regulator n=1 Tax=Serinicoccus kebangsaanensis TaxID=2602069 RepID=UPI00124DC34F|nr:GntR family transcriptional regulator [Serinicoccus kebangsaanensis]
MTAATTHGEVTSTGATPTSRSERVHQELSQQILDHQLAPGQRLIERELIDRFGVSRATVRETLRQLAAEGLVQIQPRRGAVVRAIDSDEARDLYRLRAAIEGLLVECFVERAAVADVQRLQEALDALEGAVEAGLPASEVMRVRDVFYDALFAGAASSVLHKELEVVQARVRVLCVSSLSESGRGAAAVRELRAVTQAIIECDGPRAAALMREHIAFAAAATLRTLPRPD